MAIKRNAFRCCMVLALIFGLGLNRDVSAAPPPLGSTMDRLVLASFEEAALETPGLRNLHSDEWPLTDVEFRFWKSFSWTSFVLSVRRMEGQWSWTVHQILEPQGGYQLIDHGEGPEAERLWNDVLALGVMELPQKPQARSYMLVDGTYRAVQVRIDGGYIAIASPRGEPEFRSDRIVDALSERTGQFTEAHVDWLPYRDDAE